MRIVFIVVWVFFSSTLHAADSKWIKVNTENELGTYIFRDSEWTENNYPTAVKCRSRGGRLQVKFSFIPAGPDKPYHKWNATLLREGESQADAAARLPTKGHPNVKYKIKFGCKAAGKTLLVAFRGTRALD